MRLPKRSIHRIRARRISPSRRHQGAAGASCSTGVPSRRSGSPRASAAAAGAKTSRPWNVALASVPSAPAAPGVPDPAPPLPRPRGALHSLAPAMACRGGRRPARAHPAQAPSPQLLRRAGRPPECSGKQTIVWSDEGVPLRAQGDSPALPTHAGVHDRNVHATLGKELVVLVEHECGTGDLERRHAVAEVHDPRPRSHAGEHRLHRADVPILDAEIGEQRNHGTVAPRGRVGVVLGLRAGGSRGTAGAGAARRVPGPRTHRVDSRRDCASQRR
jgi:hypothetical protein